MSIDAFNYIDLSIKLVGLVIFIFGGGKYIGMTSQMLKELFALCKEQKESLEHHVIQDDLNYRELTKNINEVKVNIASLSHGKN